MAAVMFRSLRSLRPNISLLSRQFRSCAALYSAESVDVQEPLENVVNKDSTLGSQERFPEGFNGAGLVPFDEKVSEVLMAPVNDEDVEIKPDGLIYLPEIKYRRILNKAFGPGGWALIPRGDSLQFQNDKDSSQLIVREYALFCLGRYVSQTSGEHTFYSSGNMVYGKAMESAKSNALMRCCKDLGVASELWDPQFILRWKNNFAVTSWVENVRTKEKKKLWRRKDRTAAEAFSYPWKEVN